jgi:murein DD-endopeptidase MepM/ murein hydrolase activator NlpD
MSKAKQTRQKIRRCLIMGERSAIHLKIILLLAGLGLSCSVPLWKHAQAEVIESDTKPAIVEKPEIEQPISEEAIADAAIIEKPASGSVEQTVPKEESAEKSAIVSIEQNTNQANTDDLVITSPQNIKRIQPNQLTVTAWQGSSFPVENFQTYTSAFGYRVAPDGRASQEFHYGLDMAAPEGSYVRNWWSGIVVEVSDDTACGTSVVVESGSWTATYCHMQGYVETDEQGRYIVVDRKSNLQVREGQVIPAGARIGRVGMTGRTTGPHLHWTLKYDDNYVDPAYVLRAMYQAQQAQNVQ